MMSNSFGTKRFYGRSAIAAASFQYCLQLSIMKKIYLLLFLFAFSIAGRGQQLMHDPFNYTPDATLGLSAQSNGEWQIAATGDSILVVAGSLNYSGLEASSGNKVAFDGSGTDYYRAFTTQTA